MDIMQVKFVFKSIYVFFLKYIIDVVYVFVFYKGIMYLYIFKKCNINFDYYVFKILM